MSTAKSKKQGKGGASGSAGEMVSNGATSMPDLVGNLADELPSNEAAELLDTANNAMAPILADREIWLEEAARQDAVALTWPPQGGSDDDTLGQFLRYCAEMAVDNVMNAAARATGRVEGSWRAPDDTSDAYFQLALRVCKRAVDAAEKAVRHDFARTGYVSGKRELQGHLVRKHYEFLKRAEPTISVKEAAKRIGTSSSALYRWLDKRS